MATKKSAPLLPMRPITKTWLIRAFVAVVVGLAIGDGGGVYAVNRLDPARPNAVDSLQSMIDSLSRGAVTRPSSNPTAPNAATVAAPVVAEPDSAPPSLLLVPNVVGLEEGAARNSILDAGFEVGDVSFMPSDQPAGTVLSSVPQAGAELTFGGTIALVLSDGRAPTAPGTARLSSHVVRLP